MLVPSACGKSLKLGERLQLHTTALVIVCFFFGLVPVTGFWEGRWRRRTAGMGALEEWGLAGRSFGTWVTWFLIGGDLYTAYTVIAVPALLYGSGAMGFFAVPYAVITYPYMMMVLPRLWTVCHRHGYVTFADFVAGRYGNRWLTSAIALTGVLALMPYMMVVGALTYIPMKFGGYARVFETANQLLAHHTPPATVYLKRGQFLGYSTLAIGSAIALMLYPHTATAVLSAQNANVVRRNAAMLPAYSFLLGLIGVLGYVALAAGLGTKDSDTAGAAFLSL